MKQEEYDKLQKRLVTLNERLQKTDERLKKIKKQRQEILKEMNGIKTLVDNVRLRAQLAELSKQAQTQKAREDAVNRHPTIPS